MKNTLMLPQLIAFDLDGTLLDDRKELPEENRAALEAAAERGIVCVPATGRIAGGIPQAVRSLPFLRYYIITNGAGLYDAREDRVLLREDVPLELALSCYDYLDTLPVLYDCYQDERGWMNRNMLERIEPYFIREPRMLELIRRTRTPVEDLKQSLRQRGRPLQKLQVFFRPDQQELRARQMEEIPRRFPELCATSSVSNNIEINSVRAGKGKALLALCRHLGLDPKRSVAFGDGSNDIELLRLAGLGVAMRNCQPGVREAADAVTEYDNNDAGVGREIRKLISLG